MKRDVFQSDLKAELIDSFTFCLIELVYKRVALKLEPFAILFLIDSVFSEKKSKQISLLSLKFLAGGSKLKKYLIGV